MTTEDIPRYLYLDTLLMPLERIRIYNHTDIRFLTLNQIVKMFQTNQVRS